MNDGCGYFARVGAQYAYAVALLPQGGNTRNNELRLFRRFGLNTPTPHGYVLTFVARIRRAMRLFASKYGAFWGLCPIVIHISEIEIDEALRFGDALFTDIGDERSERIVRHIEIVERSE